MNRKDAVNATRQILMNELGLTRESVREAMMEIVEDVVCKHLTKIVGDGTLNRLVVSDALTKHYRGSDGKWITIEEEIAEAARNAAEVFVKEHVRFILEPEKIRETERKDDNCS